MKKIFYILVFSMFCFVNLYSQYSVELRDIPMYYDSYFESYNTTFPPLKGNEKLTYDNDGWSSLRVYRTLGDNKELIAEWNNPCFDSMTVSANGKKLIFRLEDKVYEPVIMINGNTGKITYYFTCDGGWCTDKNLDYIIVDSTKDYVHNLDLEYDEEIIYPFYVIRLADKKIINKVEWTLKNSHGNLYFDQSDKEDYDFIVYYDVEAFTEAVAYYNVEKNLFTITYPQGKPFSR